MATAPQRLALLPSSCTCTSFTWAPSAALMRTREAATPSSASPRSTCTTVRLLPLAASMVRQLSAQGWASSSFTSKTAGVSMAAPSPTARCSFTLALAARKASAATPIPDSVKVSKISVSGPLVRMPAGTAAVAAAVPQPLAGTCGRAALSGAKFTPRWFQVGTGRRFMFIFMLCSSPLSQCCPSSQDG